MPTASNRGLTGIALGETSDRDLLIGTGNWRAATTQEISFIERTIERALESSGTAGAA